MLAGENLGLLTCRQLASSGWCHTWLTKTLADDCLVSNRTRERRYLFPLYLYPSGDQADLFSFNTPKARRPNLNPKLTAALTKTYGQKPPPEAVFHYIYAVLHAPTYREKYAAFLRMDFPRVPFPADADRFNALAGLGRRLTDLHLLASPELDPPSCRFDGAGDDRVEKGKKDGLRYAPDQARVYINARQSFGPVPEAVWNFKVGGYQVCEKWLKDRRDRRLELDDIRAYCRIVTALGLTIDIQQEIDGIYPDIENSVVSFL